MVEEILLNPNIAYLLLVGGALLAILALLNPGTGLLELAALFLLILAGYSVYNLPVNYWALLLILLGVISFLVALRRSRRQVYLAASIAALVAGSIFLFDDQGWQPAVNPVLALVVSAAVVGFLWLIAQKWLEAEQIRPAHDLGALIGAIGEAKSSIHAEGSVQVAGELWSAQSAQPIPEGARVRVVGREGFFLLVEQI
ncbi:MAG TPA: NfeD family protein [Anaerolineales bacterium]|jgi:membrane-bound serine protease (ClpP class)|nr:NfeD family protein [Anaerolineales bacterium]